MKLLHTSDWHHCQSLNQYEHRYMNMLSGRTVVSADVLMGKLEVSRAFKAQSR